MNYIFLGDSITDARHNLGGNPQGLGDGYVRVIADRQSEKGLNIMNKGHDGFTVRGLLLMLDMDCISKMPDVVTILIGVNDVGIEMNTGRTLTDQKFAENYERLLKRLRTETDAEIICMGPFIFPRPEEYLRWIPRVLEAEAIERKIAEAYGAQFIPLHDTLNQAASKEGMEAITTDGTHLTVRGAELLAEIWHKAVSANPQKAAAHKKTPGGRQMTKKKLALEVIARLKEEYPDADCTLDYDQAWKLLVSVRLAAQCTDARVNVVVEDLYAKYPDVDALAVAEVEDIEEIVRPCGLGKSKARDISACMKIIKEEYGGNVPKDFDALLRLPGVGRKSANLIMGDVFGEPAIVTDTHCIRLVNRMGLVDGIKDPKKVEMALWKIIPPEEGSDLCHRLVYHGRDVCTARTKPFCSKCCLADICAKNGVD